MAVVSAAETRLRTFFCRYRSGSGPCVAEDCLITGAGDPPNAAPAAPATRSEIRVVGRGGLMKKQVRDILRPETSSLEPICKAIAVLSVVVVIVCASIATIAAQEATNPTLGYLINTPMTLMDKGVFEIRSTLEKANENPFWQMKRPLEIAQMGAVHPSVYVLPNRIEVLVHLYEESVANSQRACHALITYVEDVLGFQSTADIHRNRIRIGGRPRFMAEKLSEIFGHYGYTPTGHPKNLGSRLLGLFAIQGGVIPNNGKKGFCHSVGGGPIKDGELR